MILWIPRGLGRGKSRNGANDRGIESKAKPAFPPHVDGTTHLTVRVSQRSFGVIPRVKTFAGFRDSCNDPLDPARFGTRKAAMSVFYGLKKYVALIRNVFTGCARNRSR